MPEKDHVLCLVCVIRKKILLAAEFECFNIGVSEQWHHKDTKPIGLPAYKADHTTDSSMMSDIAKEFDLKYLLPDEWPDAEIGTTALSEVVPIVVSQKTFDFFANLEDLYDRGIDERDEGVQFDALLKAVEHVKEAVVSKREGNFLLEALGDVFGTISLVCSTTPRMIYF